MQSKAKPTILIVDDDEHILSSLKVALSHMYDIATSTRAVHGLAQVRSLHPAAVIVDIKMPDHDGFWLFAQIRQIDAAVPVIFNSAYQDVVPPADIVGAFGPFAQLPKTGGLKDMLTVIASAIKHSQAHKSSGL